MQIQPTIQRFARMLASVCSLRLRSLMKTCVALPERAVWEVSWSPVERQLTPAPPRPETKTEKVVTQSRFDPLCEGSIVKKIAAKKHFWVRLSFYRSLCWGDKFDCRYPRATRAYHDNLREFSDYVRHISTIFVSNFWRIRGQEITSVKYSRP